MFRADRGMSLFEVLLACTLGFLLLGLLVQIAIPASKATVRASQQVELQQLALVAAHRLEQDLVAAPSAGITLATGDPLALAVHGVVSVSADGQQQWADHLAVYRWSARDERLLREEWPPAPPNLGRVPTATAVFIPSTAELDAILATRNDTSRVLATHLRGLSVTRENGAILLDIEMQAPAPDGGQPETFKLQRRVVLRNEVY